MRLCAAKAGQSRAPRFAPGCFLPQQFQQRSVERLTLVAVVLANMDRGAAGLPMRLRLDHLQLLFSHRTIGHGLGGFSRISCDKRSGFIPLYPPPDPARSFSLFFVIYLSDT